MLPFPTGSSAVRSICARACKSSPSSRMQAFSDQQPSHKDPSFIFNIILPAVEQYYRQEGADKQKVSIKSRKDLQHTILDRQRHLVIIIDDSEKYKGTTWEEHVVKCNWPPHGYEKDPFQWESADAFEYHDQYQASKHIRCLHVPVMRILCRSLLEVLLKYPLRNEGDVRTVVREISRRVDPAVLMVSSLFYVLVITPSLYDTLRTTVFVVIGKVHPNPCTCCVLFTPESNVMWT